MVDRLDANLVFVPMEPRRHDAQHSHAVISQMAHAHRATVLKGEYASGQLLSLFRHLDFAVGMRLHFLIFAALNRVPFVALPYANKVAGFLGSRCRRSLLLRRDADRDGDGSGRRSMRRPGGPDGKSAT